MDKFEDITFSEFINETNAFVAINESAIPPIPLKRNISFALVEVSASKGIIVHDPISVELQLHIHSISQPSTDCDFICTIVAFLVVVFASLILCIACYLKVRIRKRKKHMLNADDVTIYFPTLNGDELNGDSLLQTFQSGLSSSITSRSISQSASNDSDSFRRLNASNQHSPALSGSPSLLRHQNSAGQMPVEANDNEPSAQSGSLLGNSSSSTISPQDFISPLIGNKNTHEYLQSLEKHYLSVVKKLNQKVLQEDYEGNSVLPLQLFLLSPQQIPSDYQAPNEEDF